MAKYAKQLEQVLDLMLKADARKVQIKEGKLPVDIKDDKQFRQFTAEARELTRNILVTMSRDILSEQDIADLNDATGELEDTDVTADTGDAASDRIEDEERGFTDDGAAVDDVGAGDDFGADAGGEGGDDVSALVDDLLDLVGPDEAKGLIDDKAGDAGGEGEDLDEFANVDDTAIDDGEGEDLNLDDILAGLGEVGGDDEGGGDFGGEEADGAEEFDAEAGDEGGEEGEDDGEAAGDESADDGEEASEDGEESADEEEKEEAPVSESLRSRTRVRRSK